MKREDWERAKLHKWYGKEAVLKYGFVHCSSVEHMHRVAPNFYRETAPLVLLCIDTTMITAEIKWEDHDHCGRTYPHIYGEFETAAVVQALPFLRDAAGEFVLNRELTAR